MNYTVKVSPVFRFMCQGKVLESVMTGRPTDMSAIYAFEWLEIVLYKQRRELPVQLISSRKMLRTL